MVYHDEPVKTVYRHWLCTQEACGGEMIGTGSGFTTNRTEWKHLCDTCGHEEWASKSYPTIVHVQSEETAAGDTKPAVVKKEQA